MLMAYASASERTRRVATTLANASLLPELQPLERRNSGFNTCRSAAPAIRFSLAPENQRSAAFAQDSSPSKSRIVGVFSIARRKRTTCSTRCDAHPPGDSTEIENHHAQPPPCSSRSVVFNACSNRCSKCEMFDRTLSRGSGSNKR